MVKKYKIFFFLLLGLINIYAQETAPSEDLITDRPDETEAPTLVAKGSLQVETGFFYEETENDSFLHKITGYNTTLLRYGLLENLELRIGFDILKEKGIEIGSGGEESTGLKPLLLGAKIGIAEEDGLIPEMGLMGHIYLPFAASEDFRPQTTGVDFRFAFSHSFTRSDLSYNLGARWDEDQPAATYVYTIAYGYEITGRLSAFAELYGDLPENESTDHYWDAGLTYLMKNNIQLDAFFGTGINNDQKLIAGGGISFRIPQ